ncbi:glycosyltransferase family 9 protein [Acidobacteria bacterium AB60]|nr:glycosyltransferase family 9 protein [Acidobacteria bacterium AB60]
MGIRRNLLDFSVALMRAAYPMRRATKPVKIFVLRNNDLGDVAVITPLFQALKNQFPDAQIVVGVCTASKDILKHNPYVSEVADCNAPWHNHRSPGKSLTAALGYIFRSPEVKKLQTYKFDIGIDVLGSPFGSILMMRLRIPIRLGRKGYAGGHTGATAYLENTTTESVAKGVLGFASLLSPNAKLESDTKPQLFLSPDEVEKARHTWQEMGWNCGKSGPRIVFAPGAGVPAKQWPAEHFAALAKRLSPQFCGCILGSREDYEAGELIREASREWTNKCGSVTIRDSMALISLADLLVCNSSFVMHVASGFNKPSVVVLTRILDPTIHRFFWEVEGLHHALYPEGDASHVSVDAVEQGVRKALAAGTGSAAVLTALQDDVR